MNLLDQKKRVQVLQTLVEGVSIRSTERLTGVARNTISKLILDVGYASRHFQDITLIDLACKRIECDEIWSFVYAKEKNLPDRFKGQMGYGSVWTWTAICPDTKIVPTWLVGERTTDDAKLFMNDLAYRLSNKVQLTTDGFKSYPEAVSEAFGKSVNFATLIKTYSGKGSEGVLEIKNEIHIGKPKEKYISTSMVERQNLTMRMGMRRFTRKTNAHSKKMEFLCRSVDFHFMYYNFIRIHQTLKTTPAIAAGVANKVWSFEDLLDLVK